MDTMFKFYLKRGLLVLAVAVFTLILCSSTSIETLNSVFQGQVEAIGDTDFYADTDLSWVLSMAIDTLFNYYLLMACFLTVLLFYSERSKSTSHFISSLPYTRLRLYLYKMVVMYIFLFVILLISPLVVYLFFKAPYHSVYTDYMAFYNNAPPTVFMSEYMPEIISDSINYGCALILLSTLLCFIELLCGRAFLPLICLAVLVVAFTGGFYGLETYISLFATPDRLVAGFTYDVSQILTSPASCLIGSVLLFALGMFIVNHISTSRIGSMFLSKRFEYFITAICTVTGAFCVYQFLDMMDMLYSITLIPATIILLFGGALSFFITRKIINIG